MSAKKTNKLVFLFIISLALLCSFLFGGIHSINAYAIDSGQSNDFFQVEVLSNSSSSLTAKSTFSYQYSPSNSAKAYLYDVKDTFKFKFHFDFNSWTGYPPTLSHDGNAPYYQLSIKVEYLQGYSSANFTDDNNNLISAVEIDNSTLVSRRTASEGFESFSSYSPVWEIQSSINNTKVAKWGIYRFQMLLGADISVYSDFFVLQPSTASSQPTFSMYDNGLDEYTFSVIKTPDYQYIDENQIKWYAYGKTNSGEIYALLEEDLALAKFTERNCTAALYTSVDRTGYTFTLQKPDLADGEWSVWCEYTPYGTNNTQTSLEGTFIVGNPIKDIPIYWIISGALVLSVGLTILFASLKAKKDKIY